MTTAPVTTIAEIVAAIQRIVAVGGCVDLTVAGLTVRIESTSIEELERVRTLARLLTWFTVNTNTITLVETDVDVGGQGVAVRFADRLVPCTVVALHRGSLPAPLVSIGVYENENENENIPLRSIVL